MRRTFYHGDRFEYEGHIFKYEEFRDEDMREPWKEHDGHGVISDWTNRDKLPSERVLFNDDRGRSRLYYDVAATMKLARADRWGIGPEEMEKLTQQLGRTPTKGQIVAHAVEMDYDRMRGWCHGDWFWIWIKVTLIKEDDDAEGGSFETKHFATLGGIQSDSGSYLTDEAYNLASEVLSNL